MGDFLFYAAILLIPLGIWLAVEDAKKKARKRKAQSGAGIPASAIAQWGEPSRQMVCRHCQHKGLVLTKAVSLKKGVSGGKATAAVLTGGASVIATGLSRKEDQTQAHCLNCDSTWNF